MNLIKYKFILLLFLSTVLPDIFQAKADVGLDFNNNIYQNNVIKSYPFQETRTDIGVFYDFTWDKNSKQIIISRDKNNFPVIRFSLFDKKNLERQFYTMPVTTIPNDTIEFGKWLYNTNGNCKYDGTRCLQYEDERYH